MRYTVLISVVVEQSDKTSHGHNIKRTYSFGDNPKWMAAGAADVIRQTASELADSMVIEAPLDATTGAPVVQA